MQRGFLIALNTALLLGLVEGAARLAEWVHPGADAMTFAYSPYRMLKMAHAPWPLNREGFRAQDLASYRDSFLIEFLGGSVCVGVGDDPGETIPQRLERALREDGLSRARVLDLCQGGITSAGELAILIEYGLPLHPQAVLSFDGANDVLHPRPIGEDDSANLPYDNAQLEARLDGRDALSYGVAYALGSHLALLRVAGRLEVRFRPPVPSSGEPVPIGAIVASYLYHLSTARTLTQSNHAYYAILLQPTLHLDKPWSPAETAMWRSRWSYNAAPLSGVIRERYAQARAATAQWAGSHAAGLYDLTRVFANTPDTVYSDSVHFRGSRGYALLFAELQRQGLIERLRERYHGWENGL